MTEPFEPVAEAREPLLKRLPPEIAAQDDHEILLWLLHRANALNAMVGAMLSPRRPEGPAVERDPYAGVKPSAGSQHRA